MLCAQRIFEHDKLARFIALAADGKTAAAVGRMVVGRRGGRVPYMLTVAPLGVELAAYERPLAMILVADPDARSPPERDLAELFGLSPAESRLTAALLGGKKLREVADRFRSSDHDCADPVELRPAKSGREPPGRADPRTLEYPGRPRLSVGREVTSSDPLRAKVCAIASMSCTAERPAERRWPISFSRASSTTPSMASSAFRFRDDALLDKHMQDALAQHQADLAFGIRGRHRAPRLSGFGIAVQNASIGVEGDRPCT